MTYDDVDDHELFGMPFKATTDQARQVRVALLDSPIYSEYMQIEDLMAYGRFSALDPEATKLVRRKSALGIELARFVNEMVGELIKP